MSKHGNMSNRHSGSDSEAGPPGSESGETSNEQSQDQVDQSLTGSDTGQLAHRKATEFTDSLQESASVMDVDTRRQLDDIYLQIQRIRDNPALNFKARRNLIAKQVNAVMDVETVRLGAQKEAASMAILMQLDEFQLRLRARYLEMFKKLGAQVEIQQLDFLRDFGKELAAFHKQVVADGAELLPSMRESLLKEAESAFFRVKDKIAKMTADIINGSDFKRLKP